jgi:hypothetical protein
MEIIRDSKNEKIIKIDSLIYKKVFVGGAGNYESKVTIPEKQKQIISGKHLSCKV